ncbi:MULTISPECIES: TonB-dependent receptor [Acidobacteriaceae]|uniref:TonB-dependent receptor n=1 Tax=Acidobacteriaceae TaxID=204434 RepID=UPI00131C3D11|nr:MULTISPECIES: carboxypeptidase regulatory-like domain-containing protein [Acidobacteriaceae]MDW5267685.1 carboxypeptidase regulatory-like domain-containing protein [Edaphobacter sp.]
MASACVRNTYKHLLGIAYVLSALLRGAIPSASLFSGIGVLILAAASPLMAQQFATLHVTVLDPSESVVSQAEVSLRNTDTGVLRTVLSDRLGLVEIPGLAAGPYTLTVDAPSFGSYRAPLTLTLGEIASLRVALRIREATEQVEVRDTVQGVDGERTQSSQVINPHEIADLPISDRDFIDFVLLTPTATIGRNFSTGAQSAFQETVLEVSFGGLRETHSVFYGMDGIDYTTSVSGVQRSSPSLDWVQEFRVVNGPDASDGLNLGGSVNTITKSGTNDLHGSLYNYFRNNQLDANNLLSAPGFNTLRFNQFGATLGGPVRKDKIFYFAGYEGQRRAQSPLYSHFILKCIDTEGCLGPGTPSINEIKTRLGLAPENLGSILQIGDYNNAFGKVTDVLNDHSTFAVGYLFTDARNGNTPAASPGQGLPSSYRDNRIHDQTVYGNLFHILSRQWTSESSLSFGRRTFTMNPVGAGYEPAINVADTLYSGGFLGGVSYYGENHFQAKEALTYTHESNSIKVGAEFEPIWFSAQTPYFTPGVGIFSPQSFFGAAPFNAGPFGPGTAVEFIFQQPRSEFGQQVPQRSLPFSQGFYTGPDAAVRKAADAIQFWHKLGGLYVQDQWRARPNLALSFGLRYDLDFLPSAEDLRILGKMNPTNFGNVQPRVGAAYSYRNGKGVVRSSFGLFVGSFEYSSTVNGWHGASAFTDMNQPLLPAFANPSDDLVGFGPAGMVGSVGPGAAGPAFSKFSHNGIYPSPSALKQFPLGFVKRDFPNAYSEQANLEIENDLGGNWFLTVGYHYVHAIHLLSSNTINGVPNGTLSDGRQKFQPADPGFGFALYASPSGWSIYNAGTVSLRKELDHHYSVLANYTYGKSMDIATENQLQDEPQDYLQPQLDRAVSDNDMRHRLVLTIMAESPEEWVAPLRKFQFSILNTLQSPQYYSILAGSDINGDGFPFNDRVGNIGRNSYLGASYYDTDLRLQRHFDLTEKVKVNASAEFLNLLNRVNVQDVDQVYGSGEFAGPVPRRYGDGVTSSFNPTFGSPTFAGPARQIQLSARLSF